MVSSNILKSLSLAAVISTEVSAFATSGSALTNSQKAPITPSLSMHKSVPGTDDIFHNFSEESRKFRRTVYTHDEWVRHRSPDRFWRNLKTITNSGVYTNVLKEVLATTTVASFIVGWNCVFGTYQDLGSAVHDGPLKDVLPILALPLAPFTLTSSSLGLFLGKTY